MRLARPGADLKTRASAPKACVPEYHEGEHEGVHGNGVLLSGSPQQDSCRYQICEATGTGGTMALPKSEGGGDVQIMIKMKKDAASNQWRMFLISAPREEQNPSAPILSPKARQKGSPDLSSARGCGVGDTLCGLMDSATESQVGHRSSPDGSVQLEEESCYGDCGKLPTFSLSPSPLTVSCTPSKKLKRGCSESFGDDTACNESEEGNKQHTPTSGYGERVHRQPRRRSIIKAGREGWTDLGDEAWVGYWNTHFTDHQEIFTKLKSEVQWLEKEVYNWGRKFTQPRLIAYMADSPDLYYTYAKLQLQPVVFTPTVQGVKEEAEKLAGTKFNCCLLNYYRNGQDCMGLHADDEPLFGERPTIASVSFGCPRDFMLVRKADMTDKHTFRLGNGDLLVMKGTTQEHWKHGVPRRAQVFNGRINLTFRLVKYPERKKKVRKLPVPCKPENADAPAGIADCVEGGASTANDTGESNSIPAPPPGT